MNHPTSFKCRVVGSLFVLSSVCSMYAGDYPDSKVIEYMNLDVPEITRQIGLKESGLQQMAPVLIPEGKMEAESGRWMYRFMGWPHAVNIDGTIILFVRYPQSLIRSTDGGKTWEEPLFIDNLGIAVMCATASGKVVVAAVDRKKPNTVNVLISEDKGTTWKGHSAEVPNTPPHLTSRIIEHPDYGLIAGAHYSDHERRDSLYFLVSEDEGQTWDVVSFPVEVPLIIHGNIVFHYDEKHIGAFVRNKLGTGPWSPFANFAPKNLATAERFEDLIWEGGYTNIWVTQDDTPDAVFNPVSGRIEAVTTKRGRHHWMERTGGFPSTDSGYLSLNLWSMGTEAFQNGSTNWRYEGPLLKSTGEWGQNRDGGHPSGSIIDEQRGLHHTFIYMGDRSHVGPKTGLTGIFRISRTLDTEKWATRNRELENYAEIYQIDENFSTGDYKTFADWSNCSGGPRYFNAITANEAGLNIRSDKPGYYGLGNDKVIVTNRFSMVFRAKIEHFPQSGFPLAVHVNYGAEKYDVIVKKDGIYELERGDLLQHRKIIDVAIDSDWHTWKVEVRQERSEIYLDGMRIGNGSTRIDETIGQRPVVISAMLIDENDLAEMQMEYFRFENIE